MTHKEVFGAAVRAAKGLLEPGEDAHSEYLRGQRELVQRIMEELKDPESRDSGERFSDEVSRG